MSASASAVVPALRSVDSAHGAERLPKTTSPATVRASAMMNEVQRFTLDGGAELEGRLRGACEAVALRMPEIVSAGKVEALFLCGAYGRGEGGFVQNGPGEQAYAPLELHLFARGAGQGETPATLKLAGELSHKHGVEIKLTVHSHDAFRAAPPSVRNFEIATSHRCLQGNGHLLEDCAEHRDPGLLPLFEATSKLVACGIGLMEARQLLARAADDDVEQRGEIQRRLAAAQLGFGDALLIAFGQYHASCRERGQHIQFFPAQLQLPWLEELQQQHAHGVLFQVHPCRCVPELDELQEIHAALCELGVKVWLWLEGQRLRYPFKTVVDYAASGVEKGPHAGEKKGLFDLWPSKAKQRRENLEKVLETLPLLLWQPGCVNDPQQLAFVQAELKTRARTLPELGTACARLWENFATN